MIQIKVIEQTVFNVMDEGTKSNGFVVKPLRYNTIKSNQILEHCASMAMVPKTYVVATVEALSQSIKHYLLNGHSVEIPGLGIFRTSVTYNVVTNSKDAGMEQIRQINVRFLPSSDLKEVIKNAEVELEGIYVIIDEIPGVPNADGTPGETRKVYQRIAKNSDYSLDDDDVDSDEGGSSGTTGGDTDPNPGNGGGGGDLEG